jgi:hypothetical protein
VRLVEDVVLVEHPAFARQLVARRVDLAVGQRDGLGLRALLRPPVGPRPPRSIPPALGASAVVCGTALALSCARHAQPAPAGTARTARLRAPLRWPPPSVGLRERAGGRAPPWRAAPPPEDEHWQLSALERSSALRSCALSCRRCWILASMPPPSPAGCVDATAPAVVGSSLAARESGPAPDRHATAPGTKVLFKPRRRRATTTPALPFPATSQWSTTCLLHYGLAGPPRTSLTTARCPTARPWACRASSGRASRGRAACRCHPPGSAPR